MVEGIETAKVVGSMGGDGDNETVYVYRKGRNPVTRRGLQELAGEGAVKGFRLKLGAIWRGLR